MAYKRLGDMLLESGYITTSQLETALGQQKGSGKRLGEVLIDSGYITEKELIDVLCMQLGIDFVDLSNVILPTELTNVIPKSLAKKYNMVPVKVTPDDVYLAMSDPMNLMAQEEARAAARRRVVPMVVHRRSPSSARSTPASTAARAPPRAIEDMRSEAPASAAGSGVHRMTRFVATSLDGEDDARAPPPSAWSTPSSSGRRRRTPADIHLDPCADCDRGFGCALTA